MSFRRYQFETTFSVQRLSSSLVKIIGRPSIPILESDVQPWLHRHILQFNFKDSLTTRGRAALTMMNSGAR